MTAPIAPETPNYEVRAIIPARRDAILEYGGRSVLDVGCGNGTYVLALRDRYDIKGVDYRQFPSWSTAPELFGISDAATLDLPDASVETIVSFETLEHLPDPEKALREYHRVCRKNIILTVPNCRLTPGLQKSNLLYSHWIDRTHVNFFDLDTISAMIERAGFKVRKRTLINRIQLGAVVAEALGLTGFMARGVQKLFGLVQRRHYQITCLVVADKTGS